jgi:hypothetical protein
MTFPGAGSTAAHCISPESVFVAKLRIYCDDAQRVPGNTFDKGFELLVHLAFWVLAQYVSAHTWNSTGRNKRGSAITGEPWEAANRR